GQTITVTQASLGVPVCGALDITSQVTVYESGLTPLPFGSWNEFSQMIAVTYGPNVQLPIVIVLVGEPTSFPFPFNSYLLAGAIGETTCFSATGDYMVFPSPQGGGSSGALLLWGTQSSLAPIRYSVRVLSGFPSH